MKTSRVGWAFAGMVAGLAGLATSYFVAMAMAIRESPVVAVAEVIIRYTPGQLAERAIAALGHADKPFLVTVILLVLAVVFAVAGLLARRNWWAPALVFAGVALLGAGAVLQRGSSTLDLMPVVVGFVTWLITLSFLADSLHRAELRAETAERAGEAGAAPGRRGFLLAAGAVATGALVLGYGSRVVGAGRRQVEQTRRLLRLPRVTAPQVPARAQVGLKGVSPWMTSSGDFYRVDTALVVPAIEPNGWQLRIHGMVDREIVLTYDDLLARRFTEDWITLNCVSNPVGGPLIGNAWWSGVRLADLLAEAGVQAGADAVLQTSDDGWTCGTPVAALTDGRQAMLALAMNGAPLPIDHGFPVRTIVPGLYGYVSACKWVVDMEVTRFDKISAYWVSKGWSEQAPVKIASRIDVPRSGADVAAGDVRVGGVAWEQHTGIKGVEVSLDGGAWRRGQIAPSPSDDTWVQWSATVPMSAGNHVLRVRAIDKTGQVQTGVQRDVLPNGATGWHSVHFTARGA